MVVPPIGIDFGDATSAKSRSELPPVLKCERFPWLKLKEALSDCLRNASNSLLDSKGRTFGELTAFVRTDDDGGLQLLLTCPATFESAA